MRLRIDKHPVALGGGGVFEYDLVDTDTGETVVEGFRNLGAAIKRKLELEAVSDSPTDVG